MGNGVRHLAGAVAGLVAVPVIAAGLSYGAKVQVDALSGADWARVAAQAGIALLVGVLAGSRISPFASLLPGLAFTAYAVLVVTGGGGGMAFEPYLDTASVRAWALVIGGILLAASVFPARWRARKGGEAAPELAQEEVPPLPKRVPFASEKITSARPAAGPATGQ